ncbi:MAG: ABC transporter permease [Candidatus Korarchaeota archaeon]|nr:ABC transporter permease [Candidatus Korarchaeota archaeon]NIU85029.1 ABC transporter permease subunit [Candidatus Thorarchaeota archaeon]NIW15054.1 ABC transporter permease subunit [Candidatus Thorarchaeota archaeon]NIW53064.1 ABC transporter permease subunit [Candidatus Korarchaeota archaeon]
MGFKKYVIRRILTTFITLIITLTFLYFLFRVPAYLTGKSPAELYAFQQLQGMTGVSEELKNEIVKELRKSMGIPPEGATITERAQYFFMYLRSMLTFNFGYSSSVPPFKVASRFLSTLPYTLLLMGPTVFLQILLGIWLGMEAGKDPGSLKDNAITLAGLSLYSLPSYWLGPLLILIFTGLLGLYPAKRGPTLPNLYTSNAFYMIVGHLGMMLLPIVTLLLVTIGSWIYLMRNSLIDVITEDYIFTAKAKGLDERTILYRHAFRNALLPVWTNIVLNVATLWTGVIITERIFGLPGVGSMLITAISSPIDYATAQMFFYFITLSILIANFIADISYALLDPRVKYD